jgi:hypothetical protein
MPEPRPKEDQDGISKTQVVGVQRLALLDLVRQPCNGDGSQKKHLINGPKKPELGVSASGSAISPLTPQSTAVSPILTSAEPSAVVTDPIANREHNFSLKVSIREK